MSTPASLIDRARERLERFRGMDRPQVLPPVRATRDPSVVTAGEAPADSTGFTGTGAGGTWDQAPPPPSGARLVPPLSWSSPPPTLPAVQARIPDRAPDPNRYLREHGIMPQQAEARTRFSERIQPRSYAHDWVGDAANVVLGRDINSTVLARRSDVEPREDAWGFYLGLPQQSNTFAVSPHRPSRETGATQHYYAINGFLDRLGEHGAKLGNPEGSHAPVGATPWRSTSLVLPQVVKPRQPVAETIRALVDAAASSDGKVVLSDGANGVMGNFTVGLGEDERGPYVSYYDNWDLDSSKALAGAPQFVQELPNKLGKPFEIYDRIYYDPETFEPRNPR